jgi:hypothetical protein
MRARLPPGRFGVDICARLGRIVLRSDPRAGQARVVGDIIAIGQRADGRPKERAGRADNK